MFKERGISTRISVFLLVDPELYSLDGLGYQVASQFLVLVHLKFQYGSLKPEFVKSLVSMIVSNEIAKFSLITGCSLCDSSLNWAEGDMNQILSLVAETGNSLAICKMRSSCSLGCATRRNVIPNADYGFLAPLNSTD
jgi:hypothetical protein